MFARGAASAARRALTAAVTSASTSTSTSTSAAGAVAAAMTTTTARAVPVRAARTFAASMATVPFAVEAGSQAAGYMGGLLNPADLKRIENDLSTMKRTRIEGPQVPRAKAVLVPLCHDLDGVPHALFTVRADDFGAPHADFPGGSRSVDDSTAIAAAVREACAELRIDDLSKLRILGLTSDCPDVPKQTAVTPVVGYLGTVDVVAMQARMNGSEEGGRGGDGLGVLEGKSPTLMAMSLDHLLSKDSIDARLVPGVGPMPVFNASCAPGQPPLQIWGLTAQILHGVMRVVVGARSEYKDALYGPFMRKSAGASS